jgi:peptide/nickel transport system substrate-binding protein
MKRITSLVAPAVLAAAAGTGGCAPDLSCEGDWCGTLVMVSAAEPPTLLPPFAQFDIHIALADQLFWRLADVGPDAISWGHESFVPKLAQEWEFSDDSLTIVFRLNRAARWHDGTPVAARDVTFTFDVYRDTVINALPRSRLDRIASVTERDSTAVAFRFSEPYPEQFFDAVYHMRILPRHLLDTIPRAALRTHPAARNPVGSGPFRLRRWDTGESIELIADSAFFAGSPGVRRLLWRFSSDVPTMVTQLAAGEVDVLYPVTGLENIDRIKREPDLRTLDVESNAYAYVGFNFWDPADLDSPHPLFADRELRRAITMAVDRAAIVADVMGDAGVVPVGPITGGHWIWDDDIRQLPHDPDRARTMLAELGWSDSDADGVLDRNGQPLSFELLMTSTSVLRVRSAVFLQQQLRQVGIDLVVQALEPNAMGSRMSSRRFDSYFGSWLQDPSPISIAESWTTSGLNAGNYGAYTNTEIDELVQRARSEFDPVAAKELWKEIVGLINEDAPAIWIYGGSVTVGIHSRFENPSFPWDEWWKNLWTFRVTASQLIERDLITAP